MDVQVISSKLGSVTNLELDAHFVCRQWSECVGMQPGPIKICEDLESAQATSHGLGIPEKMAIVGFAVGHYFWPMLKN